MLTRERTYTVDEFLALIETLPNDCTYELIEGDVVEVSPSKAKQTTLGSLFSHWLWDYALQTDSGYVTSADGGFKLSEGDFFAPDAAFISKEKLPDGLPDDDFYRVAPDLAVEVVSKSDQYSAHKKALRYLALGTRMVLVVHEKTRTIDVYRPAEGGALVVELTVNDTLDGGDVLPGFSLAVCEVFKLFKANK